MQLQREPVKSVTVQVKDGKKYKSFSVYATSVPKVYRVIHAAVKAKARAAKSK